MHRNSPTVTLSTFALGVAAGFALACVPPLPSTGLAEHLLSAPPVNPRVSSTQREMPDARLSVSEDPPKKAQPATAPTMDAVWSAMMRSVAANQLDNKVLSEWHELVRSDPRVLQEVIRRYGTPDLRGKQTAMILLSEVSTSQVREFAIRLIDATDPSARRDGFALLSANPGSAEEVRSLARHALESEQDPQVLSTAIDALQQPPIDPTETQATAKRLNELAQNEDASVRAESIRALAQWDKHGVLAESSVFQGLSAPQPEVRIAAFAAISNSALRSDRLKGALLDMIGDSDTSSEDKARALEALQGFALSMDEYVDHHLASVARDLEAQRDAAAWVN